MYSDNNIDVIPLIPRISARIIHFQPHCKTQEPLPTASVLSFGLFQESSNRMFLFLLLCLLAFSFQVDQKVFVTRKLAESCADELGRVSPSCKDSIHTGILVAYALCKEENRFVPMRMMNSTNIDLHLQTGHQVCEFSPLLHSIFPSSVKGSCILDIVSQVHL